MKNRETSLLATRIQSWWRALRAKWLALQLLQITVEVLWDPGINQAYYFNHGLGQATWEVPSMLRRWRGEDARMPSVAEWVFISRIFGQVRTAIFVYFLPCDRLSCLVFNCFFAQAREIDCLRRPASRHQRDLPVRPRNKQFPSEGFAGIASESANPSKEN